MNETRNGRAREMKPADHQHRNGGAEAEPRDGRGRILRQARDLFVERGYAETSMQLIADAAGLRKATLYHHFTDKEELFTQVLLIELQSLAQSFDETMEGGGSFAEQLEALAYLNFAEITQPDVYRLARDFWQHIPETRHQQIHDELNGLMDRFVSFFRKATAAGDMISIDPQVVAILFFHMVMGWSTHAMDDPAVEPPDPRYAAKTCAQVLLHGVASPFLRKHFGSGACCSDTSNDERGEP